MGGSGGILSTIFGGGQSSAPSVPEYTPTPVREAEAEAEAKTARDNEARKLKARKGLSGTILTTPLGVDNSESQSGSLGSNIFRP